MACGEGDKGWYGVMHVDVFANVYDMLRAALVDTREFWCLCHTRRIFSTVFVLISFT